MGPESQRIVPAQWLRSSDRYTFPCAGPTDTVEPCQCHIGNIVKHVEATALPSSFKIYFIVAGPASAAASWARTTRSGLTVSLFNANVHGRHSVSGVYAGLTTIGTY